LNNGDTARRYGFANMTARRSNPLELFTTKSAKKSSGQLYNFTDKGGARVALRPEMTPTLRAWSPRTNAITKSPSSGSPSRNCSPTKRQQKGRLREHFQFNADLIGETNPAADAELTCAAH